MKNYRINMFYRQGYGGHIADVRDLRHCSAFGATPAEALAEPERAKEAWLEAAGRRGKPIPPPKYRPAIDQATP